MIGIYIKQKLIKTLTLEGKASQSLPDTFKQIMDQYNITRILFINGPGSFMAIKVSYVFCKTLSIIKDIPLLASDGFAFNNLGIVKAHRNLYFVKENNEIKLSKLTEPQESNFFLPDVIDYKLFSDKIKPNYILPAV